MQTPVLIVGNFLSEGAASRCVCEELALRLAATGRRVVTTSRHRVRLLRLLDMLFTILRQRQEFTVAQVDVYSGPAFLWAEAVCTMLRALHKPFVLTLHGGNLPTFAERHPARVSRLLNGADTVTAPSQYLCERMAPYRADLRYLPNALDIECYCFRLRAWPKPNLIWLRAFHDIYNPALAPRVLATLLRQFPQARLTMVGPDKGDRSFEETGQVAEQLGVRQRVHFGGQVAKSEVPAFLSRGDIFLNTTRIDNAPVSVLEAMATGLCVVSTNVGGLRYLVQDRHNALLVPPDDAQAMATSVSTVLAQTGLAAHLSRNARTKAEECDWAVVLPQWEDLLNGFSNRRQVGAGGHNRLARGTEPASSPSSLAGSKERIVSRTPL